MRGDRLILIVESQSDNFCATVCVQATHLEARGKTILEEGSKNTFKGKGKDKGFKGKGKKNACIKKEGEKLTCKHCSKEVTMKLIVGSFIPK